MDRNRKSPTGHNLFTDISWSDHEHSQRGMTPEARQRDHRLEHWAACHDMEVYLSEGSDIPIEWARVIVSAALNGMPVTLTVRHRDMTVTETGIVTQVFGPKASHFYWRTWGSSHPVYFNDVVTVHTPDTHTVLHTPDGDKVLSNDDYEPSRKAKVFRDGSVVTLKGTIERYEQYAAVSRVGTGPVPPAE
jgi:hypothetical protein